MIFFIADTGLLDTIFIKLLKSSLGNSDTALFPLINDSHFLIPVKTAEPIAPPAADIKYLSKGLVLK